MKRRMIRGLGVLCCIAMTAGSFYVPVSTGSEYRVEAATAKIKENKDNKITYGEKAKIEVESSYKGASFTSSNKKVATVDSKGVVTAKLLGVTTITAKAKGKKSRKYEITVVPRKEDDDLRLNQNILFCEHKTQLKFVSDHYDTSQIQIKAKTNVVKGCITDDLEELCISKNGLFDGEPNFIKSSAKFYYGSYQPKICELLFLFSDMLTYADEDGGPYRWTCDYRTSGKPVWFYYWEIPLEELLKTEGMTASYEGKPVEFPQVLTSGNNKLTLSYHGESITSEFIIRTNIMEAVDQKELYLWDDNQKAVLKSVLDVVNDSSVIREGMSDKEKVKALHDYIIHHADYATNYKQRTDGRYASVAGILQDGNGICQAYAVAFQILCEAASVSCRYVAGKVGDDYAAHAWNQVLIDGEWYYVDCCWDDPTDINNLTPNGGYERDQYFLSKELWSDHHTIDTVHDFTYDTTDSWCYYWLDGRGYAKDKDGIIY